MTNLSECKFTDRLIYSSDVSPEHCHGLIAYKDHNGEESAIYVAYCEDSEEWELASHEIYTEREEWAKDIEFQDQYQYTQDVLLYYGPQSLYIEYLTEDELTYRLLMFGVIEEY